MNLKFTFFLSLLLMLAVSTTYGQANRTSALKAKSDIGVIDYQPLHLAFNLGKTDDVYVTENYGLELNAQRRITNYLNYGAGVAYYRYENNNDGGFGAPYPYVGVEQNIIEPSAFLNGYLPLNALMGKTERKNTGLFAYVTAGVFYHNINTKSLVRTSASASLQTAETTTSEAGFYNEYGVDYKFTHGFGLSVYTQKFSNFWFGINFQF